MPRASNGVYTLPNTVNPVIPGTTITSIWANTTLVDVAQALTDSLDRAGRGSMTAALKITDGTVSLPGLSFSTEVSSGLYRAGAGDLRLAVLGVDELQIEPDLVTVPGNLVVVGTATADPAVLSTELATLGQLNLGSPTVEEDLASAATTDIGGQGTNKLNITGTTTITSLGTDYGGPILLRFSGSLLLTHGAALVLPYGGENFQTQAGDTFIAWAKATTGVADGWILVPVGATTMRLASGTTGLRQGTIFKATAGFTVNTGLIPDTIYLGVNNSASNITITEGSGVTLRQSGTTNTGNRTCLPRGEFRIWALSTTEYYISGTGVI